MGTPKGVDTEEHEQIGGPLLQQSNMTYDLCRFSRILYRMLTATTASIIRCQTSFFSFSFVCVCVSVCV